MVEVSVKSSYTIKELPETERPREKIAKIGVGSLSNEELLGVIIGSGYRDNTAVDLGRQILALDKSGLRHLKNITLEELTRVKGIGHSKASQILAAIELGNRISYERGLAKIQISNPITIANLFLYEMSAFTKEHFRVILLDIKNQIISIEEISIGTLNSTIVHPRDVFRQAIKKSANSMILIHNHPSGDVNPSREDIQITKRLLRASDIIGIKILDHLIIGDGVYLSFKEEKLI